MHSHDVGSIHSHVPVPEWDDPRLRDFLQRHEASLEHERSLRSDAKFRSTLSPAAQAACSIVHRIRKEEQATLWTDEFEDSLAKGGDIYPGMMFSLAKDRMERSELYKIIRDMPKGALLHCHLEAMVEFPWLLREILITEGACIRSEQALVSPEVRLKAVFGIEYVPPQHVSQTTCNIWDTSYELNSLVPVHLAAETFPDGGKEGFIEWVTSRCTISPEDAINHHNGPYDIWRKFSGCFLVLAGIINYEPVFRKFMFKMCQDLRRDGVQWVDIRTVFGVPYYRTGASIPEESYDAKLKVAEEIIKSATDVSLDENKMPREFKEDTDRMPSEQMPPFWGASIIWTTLRRLPQDDIIKDMRLCISMKLKHPELIAGYDLVGQEDLGRPLKDLLPELFWFMNACKDAGVHIPFFFHAGETLGTGDDTDNNLHTAIQLGTRRIGHGFSLYKHPTLIDSAKEKQILIESCPVSNEVLRLTGSIMSNPLPALLAQGVPVALCNDDPAILGQGATGMTHDFWQALQGWENLGLAGLGSLAQNSVRWANFENISDESWLCDVDNGVAGSGIRAERLKQWNYEWEMFCLRVVDRYGGSLWEEIMKHPQTMSFLNI